MSVPYVALSHENSQVPSEWQDEPCSTTTASIAAAHIRSFYRLFAYIAVLLLLIGIGVAAIITSSIAIRSCSAAYEVSRSLGIIGIIVIIICIILALMLIARATCCYQRSACLCYLVQLVSTISFVMIMMSTIIIPIILGHYSTLPEVETTNAMGKKGCENIVRIILYVIQGLCSLLILSTTMHSVCIHWKERCKRRV